LEPIARRKSKRAFPTDVDVIEMGERNMTHLSIQFESQTLCSYSNQLSAFAPDAAAQVPIEHKHAIRWIVSGIHLLRRREIDLLQRRDFHLVVCEQPTFAKPPTNGIVNLVHLSACLRHDNGRFAAGRYSEITVAEPRALLAKAAFDDCPKFLQFLKRTPYFSGRCRFHSLAIISNVLSLRNCPSAFRFLSANLIQLCGTQTGIAFDRTQSIRSFYRSVLSRVAAQDQSAVPVPNETNQIKQLSSVELAGFVNDNDCAFR
jgi:hypothetical protein